LIDAYFANEEHIGQSSLKGILHGVDAYKAVQEQILYYEEKTHFTIGSAVDTILTQGKGVFRNTHHVTSIPKPTGKTLSIINYVFDNVRLTGEEEVIELAGFEQTILDGCIMENFHNEWGNSARVNYIVRNGEPYFNDLIKAMGKTVLSPEEVETSEGIVKSLKESQNTQPYFVGKHMPRGVDMHYQVPIYFVYKDVLCKALLDIVAVDHRNKLIRPLDLKTMGDYTIMFPKSIRRFRYDIQGAFYTEALMHAIPEGKGMFSGLTDYGILPFAFIVESTKVQGNPLIYQMDESLLKIGKHGRDELFIGDKGDYLQSSRIKGFDEAIDLLIWHRENGFDKDKDVVDADGVFQVDWNRKW